MRREHSDSGLVLAKVVIFAAIAVPVGIYAFHAVQTAVRKDTLRSDVRNAVSVEALCNQDRNGAGYSTGNNVAQGGGAFVLNCAGVDETVSASSGNEITISVTADGNSFTVVGYQPSTGLRVRYNSTTGQSS